MQSYIIDFNCTLGENLFLLNIGSLVKFWSN